MAPKGYVFTYVSHPRPSQAPDRDCLVTVSDGFGACASNVPVEIQRLRNGTWRTIDTTQTDGAGLYREHIADRVGVYRSVAKRVELNNGLDVCARDRSPRERHTH